MATQGLQPPVHIRSSSLSHVACSDPDPGQRNYIKDESNMPGKESPANQLVFRESPRDSPLAIEADCSHDLALNMNLFKKEDMVVQVLNRYCVSLKTSTSKRSSK